MLANIKWQIMLVERERESKDRKKEVDTDDEYDGYNSNNWNNSHS